MDTSSERPTQGASGVVGDPTLMESTDWRAQLQRQRIVNKLMDTLKRHIPLSGYERLKELKKIVERVEEEIYTAATSQSEYSRKICLNMLIIETRLQNPMSNSLQSNSLNFLVPSDLTTRTGNPNGGDWQEEVYQKIKAMKELYLLDLRPTQGASGSKVTNVKNQGQQRPIHVPYQGQQMMSQSMHINIGSTGIQGSSSLSFALPPSSGLQRPTMATNADQHLNLQLRMSSVQQNHLIDFQYNYSHMMQQQQKMLVDHQNLLSSLQQPSQPSACGAVGDPTMESGDWRAQLPPDSRERIQNKILDSLKKHLPFFDDEGLNELKKIAVRFEEKTYNVATSQIDYLRKISLKILTMETRSQDPMSDTNQTNSAASSVNSSDLGVSL